MPNLSVVGCARIGARIARGVAAAGTVAPGRCTVADARDPSSLKAALLHNSISTAPVAPLQAMRSHATSQRHLTAADKATAAASNRQQQLGKVVMIVGNQEDAERTCEQLRSHVTESHIIISTVEGLSLSRLAEMLGNKDATVVRLAYTMDPILPTTAGQSIAPNGSGAEVEERATALPCYLYVSSRQCKATDERVEAALRMVFPKAVGEQVADETVLDDVETMRLRRQQLGSSMTTSARNALAVDLVGSLARTGMPTSWAYHLAMAAVKAEQGIGPEMVGAPKQTAPHDTPSIAQRQPSERLSVPEHYTIRDFL